MVRREVASARQDRGRRLRVPASRSRAGVLLLSLLGLLACTAAPFDREALEQRYPVLAATTGDRLEDLHPYVLPANGVVWFLTCRWTTEHPVGVWISAAFDERETRLVERALAAWEQAGLGVRFQRVGPDEAQLRIGLADPETATETDAGAGLAVVDCGLDPATSLDAGVAVLPAELVAARITLTRQARDALGRPQTLSDAELLGAALHELGHALGFQGHVRGRAGSALVRAPESLRALGARLLAGEPFDDPTLRALYQLPSGTVLTRTPSETWRTRQVDRMAVLARSTGLAGPLLRVGDRAARIYWRADGGEEYGLQVINLKRALRDPRETLIVPEALTRYALPRSGDRPPTRR